MLERSAYEYVLLRIVPRVERGETINAGVILICRAHRFLQAAVGLDRLRFHALFPEMRTSDVDELERQLELICRIARGDPSAGPIAGLELAERWHWLAAPASTMIQPSPIHTGLCVDPEKELDLVFRSMVMTGPVRNPAERR
ncbi:DUF3037 domain-containing protein [soil metagenome]